jgi:D-tagatose-1,6-bisphosphate aldolase subunit GatZ/KbaZ
MYHPVDGILRAQKRGEARGITSICSAHPWVLKTALNGGIPILIEATCNQVNQFGGYTGMTPEDFVAFVRGLAGSSADRIIFGGDHLGPSPWQEEPAERAMMRAVGMVQAYVRAGFTKIHLDASMPLGDDDPSHPLDLELAAHRTAILARAAEEALPPSPRGRGAGRSPMKWGEVRYVIGTEVPIPGGATVHEEGISVTRVEDARNTIDATYTEFVKAGLDSAWERVIALVVQPGVEFGDDFILDYRPGEARDLARFSETTPLVYEAHSTDYQTRMNLQNLVRDHFAILKVGPALTFAFREAIFSLALIEQELIKKENCSQLIETLEEVMLRDPRHWQKHYRGTDRQQAFARKFSLSDRVRYYWPVPEVQAAVEKLISNLDSIVIPLPLLSQYAPRMYARLRMGELPNRAASILECSIRNVLEDYEAACGMN